MKKILPFMFPVYNKFSEAPVRAWKYSLAALGLIACGSIFPNETLAQYVWNGVDGTGYTYAGTAEPPWSSDTSKTGKWVTNGANALFSGESILNSTQESLTVENAAVTFDGKVRDNSSLTINAGGTVNIQGGLWLANGNYTPSLTINPGGTPDVTGESSYISDNKSAVSTVIINGGTMNFPNGNLVNFGHHGAITMELKNNGRLESTGTIVFGAGDKGSASTNIPAERILTIGTSGSSEDQSVLQAKSFSIGSHANGKVILESGSILSDSTIFVGQYQTGTLIANGGTIRSGSEFSVGHEAGSHGILDLKNVQLDISGKPIYFGNQGTADVRIENSTLNASSMVVANVAGANGTVLIKDSAVTLTSAEPFFHKSGKLTLDNVTLNSSIMQNTYVWGSQSVDSVTELKNMTLTFNGNFRINSAAGAGNSSTMIVGEGGHLELKNGFWMANAANMTANLEIRDGGKVSVKGTAYLADHRSGAYAKAVVSGGTFQAEILNLGWWGPMDVEVSNGGTISASSITFNSNTGSDPADTRTGDLTISGAGSKFESSGTIIFGNTSRDKVTVNLQAAETGFGLISAQGNISSANVDYVLDAAAPIIFQNGYSAENGIALMTSGGTISAFSGTLTSGDWTASLSADKKTVSAKRNSNALGTVSANGPELQLKTPAESGWVWIDAESTDPFQLTMTVDGLGDMDSMTAFVDILNESFTTFRAEAVSEQQVLLTDLGSGFSDAMFAWDLSTLSSAGFNDLAIIGFSGQNVPEPGTWILLLSGSLFLLRRKKRQTQL